MRSGRLLDARWFPDDVALEDAHFGAPVAVAGPSDIEKAFETAQATVKALAKPPGDAELLGLYAFYKQATLGDVSGERPGMMDVTGRAKYDAWAQRKGDTRDVAMAGYAKLVEKLSRAG